MKAINVLTIVGALLLASCSKDIDPAGNTGGAQGTTTHVRLSLVASAMDSGGSVTRSMEDALNVVLGDEKRVETNNAATRADATAWVEGELTVEAENKINDLCVFQFGADGKLKFKNYAAGLESTEVNIPLLSGIGRCNVYVLANVGDVTENYTVNTTQESSFKSSSKTDQTASVIINGGLPMCGNFTFESSDAGATSQNVTLTRLVAKVALSLKTENGSFAVGSVTLENVPKNVWYVDQQAEFEVTSYGGGTNTDIVWYMPENKQGTGAVSSATAWTERYEGKAPQSGKATYIRVAGEYISAGGEKKEVVFVIYPGKSTDANDFNVVRNTKYTVTATIKGTNLADARVMVGKDLSMDADGKPATANCYLVNQSNTWYRFKGTIRGNGSVKTDPITLPAGVAAADESISPAAAELVWETGKHGGVIEYVGWSASGYVTFKTGDLTEGNAVIAVKANTNDNEALWSWHIWRTSFDLAGMNAAHTQTYKTNLRKGMNSAQYWNNFTASSRELVMMDRDLGAASNTPSNTDEVTKTFGLYYQFGRKDPFPTASTRERRTDNNSEIVDVFDKGGNKLTAADLRGSAYQIKNADASTDAQGIISYAIQHPLTFILRDDNDKSANGGDGTNSSYNWIYGAHPANYTASKAEPTSAWIVSNRLWGGQFTDNKTSLRLDTEFTGKTIYDPCPPGWCMPPQDTWTNFTTTNTGETPAGTDYNTSNTTYYNCPDADKANYEDGNGKGFMLATSGVFGRRYYVNGVGTGTEAFYPSAGYRYGGNGQVVYVGYGCYAWSSAPFQARAQNGGFLSTDIGWVRPVYDAYRSGAFPVRCVQESSVTE